MNMILLLMMLLIGCNSVDSVDTKCDDIQKIVETYCSTAGEDFEEYYSCFVDDESGCQIKAKRLEEYYKQITELNGQHLYCEADIIMDSLVYEFCDANECEKIDPNCPNSEFYFDSSIHPNEYKITKAFGPCAVSSTGIREVTDSYTYGICMYGKCLSEEEIKNVLCKNGI